MGSVLGTVAKIGLPIIGGILEGKSRKKEAGNIQAAADKWAGTAMRGGRRGADIASAAGEQAAGYVQPYNTAGQGANAALSGALGLGGAEGMDNAFKKFLDSTGYRSQLELGQDAITSSAAARGALQSGATLKELTSYGQDLAQQGYLNYLNQLNTMANRGLSAGQAAAGQVGAAGRTAGGIYANAFSNAGRIGVKPYEKAAETQAAGSRTKTGSILKGVGSVLSKFF